MTDTKKFWIELDNYPEFYFPGQTITGRVIRIVTEPNDRMQYFWVNFQGVASVRWNTTQTIQRVTQTTGRVTTLPVVILIPHTNQETYFDHTIHLNQQNDVIPIKITSLPIGRHAFPFVYHLPVGIPGSYYSGTSTSAGDAEFKISYQIQAIFLPAGRGQSEMKAEVSLRVERPIDLNYFPWAAQPVVIEDETTVGCCCCESEPISFKLTFNKTGFLIGENIQFMAEFVNNTNRAIERIEVWIARLVMFQASDQTTYTVADEEEIGSRFTLPIPSPRQTIKVPISLNMIPNHTQINSYGCSFMNSSYVFRLRTSIPCGNNLKGRIPIVIGVVPLVIQLGRPD